VESSTTISEENYVSTHITAYEAANYTNPDGVVTVMQSTLQMTRK
jgi:hypothetical protein